MHRRRLREARRAGEGRGRLPYWATFATDGAFNDRGPCGGRSVYRDFGARLPQWTIFTDIVGKFSVLLLYADYVYYVPYLYQESA